MDIISALCLFGIPAAVFIGFIVCVVKYRTCPAEAVTAKKSWRTAMIATGIVSLVFIAVIAALMALLTLAVTNM